MSTMTEAANEKYAMIQVTTTDGHQHVLHGGYLDHGEVASNLYVKTTRGMVAFNRRHWVKIELMRGDQGATP